MVVDVENQIYVFAVNHARRGEEIVLFSHQVGSTVLTFVREFKHPKIKTPNAVAATSLKYDNVPKSPGSNMPLTYSQLFLHHE
jgi:hypothetical protein